MKKCLIIIALVVCFPCVGFCQEGTMEFVGNIDVGRQSLKVYTTVVAEGGNSIHRKIVVIKDGIDIFPERYPDEDGFLDSKDRPFFTYIGSFGGYSIDKFDLNLAGSQILLFSPNETLQVSGDVSRCWQKSLSDNLEGKIVKRVFVCGKIFKFDASANQFVCYKKDIVEYNTDNKPGSKEKIAGMFKRKTNFSRAFDTARKFLTLLKNSMWQEAQNMCGDSDSRKTVAGIAQGYHRWNPRDYNFETWRSNVDFLQKNNGTCFYYGYRFYDKGYSARLSITVNDNMKITRINSPF